MPCHYEWQGQIEDLTISSHYTPALSDTVGAYPLSWTTERMADCDYLRSFSDIFKAIVVSVSSETLAEALEVGLRVGISDEIIQGLFRILGAGVDCLDGGGHVLLDLEPFGIEF